MINSAMILDFWFKECTPKMWFKKDIEFDQLIKNRFQKILEYCLENEINKNPITKDVVTLKNEEAIKQAVKNLVLTQINERPFNPLLGTNTTSYLFELSKEVGEQKLIDEIERVITENEPRVALEAISVDLADDENAFEVYIEYLIIGASPEIQELSFILVRES